MRLSVYADGAGYLTARVSDNDGESHSLTGGYLDVRSGFTRVLRFRIPRRLTSHSWQIMRAAYGWVIWAYEL